MMEEDKVMKDVLMLTTIDMDFDNPDIERCKELVKDDFAHKILTLFKENPYGMRYSAAHCRIYTAINKKWGEELKLDWRVEDKKKVAVLSNVCDHLSEYIEGYIRDYMSHVYIGRNVKEPSAKDIRNWCGGGEFPFLEVSLVQGRRKDDVTIFYRLAR